MVVYRLEKRDQNIDDTDIGVGVYINSFLRYVEELDSMYDLHNNGGDHPSLREDLPMYDDTPTEICRTYFCACTTIKKLEKWFDGYIDEILKYGYVIVQYTVNERVIGISKKQCFFQNDHIIDKKIIRERILEIVVE